jgi:hypothetical protein
MQDCNGEGDHGMMTEEKEQFTDENISYLKVAIGVGFR